MKVWSGQLLFFVFVMLLVGHLAGRDGPKKPPSQPVLQLDHRLELPSYSTDEVTVGLQVRVKALNTHTARAPVGLTAVVDTSGSMVGPRLDMLKRSLRFLGSEVARGGNFMGVLAFCTTVKELMKFQKMDEAALRELDKSLEELDAYGRTDIFAGLSSGVEQINGEREEEPKCQTKEVFLFTDGDPNTGITKKKKLLESAVNTTGSKIRLTTFPFGAAANFDLLQDIAEVGHGESYPISMLEDVANAFAMAAVRLQTTVAQNIEVILSPVGDVRIDDVMTAGTLTKKGRKDRKISFANLAKDEHRIPYISLKVPKGREGFQEVLLVKLKYEDVTQCRKEVEEVLVISINRKEAPEEDTPPDQETVETLCRFMVGECFKNGTELFRANESDASARAIDDMKVLESELNAMLETFPGSEMLKGFSEGMDIFIHHLEKMEEPSPYEMALFREIGDSSFKGSTSLPSIDTDDFHFLKFYDTKASLEARERARQAVEGIRDFVPSPKGGFPPFPGSSQDP